MSWEKPEKKPGYQINLLKLILIVGIIASGSIVGVYAVMQWQKSIPTTGQSGTVKAEIYSDPAATQVLTAINWGIVDPNTTVTKPIYIKNTGNLPVMLLLEAQFTNATQSPYFTYLDDYNGEALLPGVILTVNVGVKAAEDLSGVPTWGFNLIVTATQT